MAEVIELRDGSDHTILEPADVLELIEEYMGYEAKDYIQNYVAENTCDSDEYESELRNCEKELEDYQTRMDKARKGVEQIMKHLNDREELKRCVDGLLALLHP